MVWFLPGTKLEAKTLRELQLLLPRGTKIVNYDPDGYKGNPRLGMAAGATRIASVVKPRVFMNTAAAQASRQRHIRGKGALTSRYDQILDLWKDGLDAPTIATRLGLKRWQSVSSLVCEARKNGDPRAVSRVLRRVDHNKRAP